MNLLDFVVTNREELRRHLGLGDVVFFEKPEKKAQGKHQTPKRMQIRVFSEPATHASENAEMRAAAKGHLAEIAATRRRYMKTQKQIAGLKKKTDAILAKLS